MGTGAWVFALLQQSQQLEHGGPGECSARRQGIVRDDVGSRDGEAQAHAVPVGHGDLARTPRRMADGHDPEAPPEQRMGRVGYLDLFGVARWVLEGGIMLVGRLTIWIMTWS